jgi:hypothetical protein
MYKLDSDNGINAGLRLWIVFMVSCWLVGIRPAVLCILLGAIGGLATGYIVAYWGADKVDIKPTPPPETVPDQSAEPSSDLFTRPRRIGAREWLLNLTNRSGRGTRNR